MAGGHAVRLSYFIKRLICANGLAVQVTENEGRVVHTGTREAFLDRLTKGTGSILGSLANAKRLIEDLGNLNFNAESLAKFANKKEIFSIIPNLDLAQECKDKLRGKDYSAITDKADKTLDKMRTNPRDWRIDDLEAVAKRHGLTVRKPSGSHVIFKSRVIR